jgi:hypothetical protein
MHISPANLLARIMKLENGFFSNNGETWHLASLSGSGWAASTFGVNGIYYRMNRDGDLQLAWDITASASPVTVLPAASLPTGYYDPNRGIYFNAGPTSSPTSYNASFAPMFWVTASGGISAQNIYVTGLRCVGCLTVPVTIG